jgi:hypothetical protein
MCFNAFKNYKFGWYSDHTVFVNSAQNGPWTGEIASFVDASQAFESDVLIQMGDTYMQLNSAKRFNEGTKEEKKEVVIVEGTQSYLFSDVVAGLGAGDSISVGGNTIHVCSITFGSIDFAEISIFTSGQSSGCPGGGGNPEDPNKPWWCFIPLQI